MLFGRVALLKFKFGALPNLGRCRLPKWSFALFLLEGGGREGQTNPLLSFVCRVGHPRPSSTVEGHHGRCSHLGVSRREGRSGCVLLVCLSSSSRLNLCRLHKGAFCCSTELCIGSHGTDKYLSLASLGYWLLT